MLRLLAARKNDIVYFRVSTAKKNVSDDPQEVAGCPVATLVSLSSNEAPLEVGPKMSSVQQSNRAWKAGQAHPDVVLVGDPGLRAGGQEITDFEASAPLFQRLVSLLRELNGAGLAATQLGEQAAAVVVEVRKTDVFPDRPTSPLIQMANPRITRMSEEVEEGWEGCFSVPGLMGLVNRSTTIEVTYQDPEGTPQSATFEGYIARVIQHEIDHLSGQIFLDKMASMQSLTTVENYTRFHAKHVADPSKNSDDVNVR
jgi:peptide deformylase